ncbi:DNA-binding LacI/PurR family transcriptional regulator [Paenibacillus castaneae]|uniref:LacI family DNA-binding transcriptional regulator n=1 Tax=Paenibacillus castaneae TaxID=474957 RepID=UPI000C9BACF6|nr:LacI family DNA-binding transcriptional regulator [Paenibacillus castaneae]NIK78764.1 DNA-binding LacI/PurR family transcriptional regulator [Paenibacillus castaneae]
MATIDDVAREAGVSKGTVSNVFSKKRPISKEVTERVLEVAKALNYKPNYWARSLANKSTRIIGLNIQGEKFKFSQFHLSLLNGVLSVCYEHGYRLLVNTLSQSYLNQVEQMVTDPIDGEILLDPEIDDQRIIERLADGLPVVLIGRPSPEYENRISYVDNDNVGMTEQITQYLLDLGHRNFLFLNAPKHRTVAVDRARGFLNAVQEAELPQSSHLIVFKPDMDNSSLDFGYETTLQAIRDNHEITAIIADTDTMALGAYKAAETLGIDIPSQLSVFAFSDDSVFSPEFTPPLTGVRLYAERLGREAASMLIEQMTEDVKSIKRTIVPTEMIIRSSCANHNTILGGIIS